MTSSSRPPPKPWRGGQAGRDGHGDHGMKLLLVGHGRMGRLVESLAPEYQCEIVGRVDRRTAERPQEWPAADVAIDFSHAEAVPANFSRLAGHGTAIVVGTTG